MTELERQFAVSHYLWAKAEFQREIDAGFPVLSTLRCRSSLTVYDFMNGLSRDEQLLFASALLRRGIHNEAARFSGDPFSDTERAILDRYSHRTKVPHLFGTSSRIGPSSLESKITALIESGKLVAQRPNKAFQDQVRKRVAETLGIPKVEKHGGANTTITLISKIGDWAVHTLISFSSKVPLRYSQVLSVDSVPGFNPHVSFLTSLGIMGDTTWDLLTTDVAEDAVETLVGLCRRFLVESPKWLPQLAP